MEKVFKLRFISSLWILGIGLWIVAAGGVWFFILATSIILIGMHEWSLLSIAGKKSEVFAYASIIFFVLGYWFIKWFNIFILFCLLCACISIFFVRMKGSYRFYSRLIQGVGISYLIIGLYSLLWLRVLGVEYFTLLLIVVIATDIFSYFSGKLIGGRQLAPTISPKKTWAGALIGGVISVFLGSIYAIAFFHKPIINICTFCLIITILSQIGDLFISMLKRIVAVKDTGHLFPGHGGVLDRFDGLILASIGMFLLMLFHVLL